MKARRVRRSSSEGSRSKEARHGGKKKKSNEPTQFQVRRKEIQKKKTVYARQNYSVFC